MFENSKVQKMSVSFDLGEAGSFSGDLFYRAKDKPTPIKEVASVPTPSEAESPANESYWSETPLEGSRWEEDDVVTLRRVPAENQNYVEYWEKISES